MDKLDDTFLARWLNGDLNAKEEESFKNSKDYESYSKIIRTAEKFDRPIYNEDEVLNNIKNKIANKPKGKVINFKPFYGVAASIMLLFGLFYFLKPVNTISINSTYGEHLVTILPDGSEITLNANSSIEYNKKDWSINRTLNLSGEAFFKVQKGSSFKVITDQGTVEVLGTQFNVYENEDYFEVKCYTGKVKVIDSNKSKSILTKGKAHRKENKKLIRWNFNTQQNFWKKGFSTFNKTPFNEIINALENQFHVEVINASLYEDQNFSGSFSNNDLDLAIKTVFAAMEIEYSKEKNRVTLK